MGRPKGAKNKSKTEVAPPQAQHVSDEIRRDLEAMGISTDPMVTPTPEPVEHKVASGAFRPEFLDIDAKLAEMAFDTPNITDQSPPTLVKNPERRELLADHIENYKPASTVQELEEQVYLAKQAGCDSIEGTEQLIRHFCRRDFEYIQKSVGYFQYKDIKVCFSGSYEKATTRDRRDLFLNTTASRVGK